MPALLLAQLFVILAAAHAAGALARRWRQPRVIGEMAAGVVLGPSLIGAVAPGAWAALFPASGHAPLAALSQLGTILFMLTVGLRLDVSRLRHHAGAALAISHSSILLPFLLGAGAAVFLYPSLAGDGAGKLPFVLFLGAAMSVTAFPVLAQIVDEHRLRHTRVGAIAIAAAATDDVTAWAMLAAVVAVSRGEGALLPVSLAIGGVAIYAAFMTTAARRALAWWQRRRLADRAEHAIAARVLVPIVLLALASALVTELLGVHSVFGAFLAGTIVPRERGLADAAADRIDGALAAVLLPIFFAFTGLQTEIGLVAASGLWGTFGLIVLLAVVGKFAGSAIAARLTGCASRESAAIGLLMNTRGLMELVILNVGLEIGVIAPSLFAIMVLMALATTIMTSPLLTMLRLETAAAAAPAYASAAPVGAVAAMPQR